ncbi:hypothetical protein RD792_007024 [Penstemon davidsonii]|uniref:Pentatricopeptide repeat-containing protein n=1 Tax=Penstemon davidsonii TaxID=160366 RepID=A0ABR0D5H8_9LAMI|nr:hypothetical protein RD792_007024 [Penstemon davidsonii]
MSDRTSLQLSSEDFAVMLDLTERVRVIKDAENYLNNIPDTMNKFNVYCALLRGYARNRLLHKSEEVMQRLREMNYRKPFAYNLMMGLYSHTGNYKKIEALLREMEEKQINGGKTTFRMQLDVYASNGNIEGMNKLLHEKKNDPEISENWKVFAVLANGYLKAGQAEKSREMLREIEKRIDRNTCPSAYRTLVSMYADLGDIEEVYRVWNLMKNEINIRNTDYYNMISSLVTLDDFDGAEKILKEWESINKIYDFRISRLLIKGYVEKGLFEKAEELVKRIIVTQNKNDLSLCFQMIKACDSSSINSRDVTFICGRAGVCALGAVVAKYLGDDQLLYYYLAKFKEVSLHCPVEFASF